MKAINIEEQEKYKCKITIQERMKTYEKVNSNESISSYKPFIARLDGVNFSKYTQGFDKPYDILFRTVMILTMNELVDKFQATTGYTQSDEITLIFPAVCTKDEYDNRTNNRFHYRKGRKMKICSILSSSCTSRFLYYMMNLMNHQQHKKLKKIQERIEKMSVSFDCRLIEYPDDKEYEILNHQIWRSLDCERNAILQYGMYVLGNKKIFKMNCKQICESLQNKSYNYLEPKFILYGVYCKKISYTHIIDDKETQRSKYINKTFEIKYSDEILKMLFSKYLYNSNELMEYKDDNEYMLKKYNLECRSLKYNEEKYIFEEFV